MYIYVKHSQQTHKIKDYLGSKTESLKLIYSLH